MKQRTSKIRSLEVVDPWTLAEIGKKRAKRIDKTLIKRKRRTLEKHEAKRIIDETEAE